MFSIKRNMWMIRVAERQLVEVSSLFLSSGSWIQVIRIGGRNLYSTGHFAKHHLVIFKPRRWYLHLKMQLEIVAQRKYLVRKSVKWVNSDYRSHNWSRKSTCAMYPDNFCKCGCLYRYLMWLRTHRSWKMNKNGSLVNSPASVSPCWDDGHWSPHLAKFQFLIT